MSVTSHGVEDEYEPNPDFTAGPFVTRRDPWPVQELIHTFSELYINSEDDNDSNVPLDDPLPLPPPPDDDKVSDIHPSTQVMDSLTNRISALEGEVQACTQKMSQCCSHSEFMDQCRLLEEKLTYKIERGCERVKKILELSIGDLGKSVVDCMKRRDAQIDNKLKSYAHVMSTPVSLPLLTPALSRNSNRSCTEQAHLCKPNLPDTAAAAPYRPPVRVEFPRFGSDEDNDPITFVEG